MADENKVPSKAEGKRSVDWDKAAREVAHNFARKLKAQVEKNAQRAHDRS